MKKILVVGGSMQYASPFVKFGEPTSNDQILDTPEDVLFVLFTGGEDVSPALYSEQCNRKTYSNSYRDKYELLIFEKANQLGLPMVGICRGSQFLCVMAGGKLVQHVNNHGTYHDVMTDDDRLVHVSSTHHQMQLPPEGAVPLAWAHPSRSNCYEGAPGVNYDPDREHDCVYYPNIKAIGMQYHPEYMSPSSDGFKYAGELVERFFLSH